MSNFMNKNQNKKLYSTVFITIALVCSLVFAAKYYPHVYPVDCVGCGDCIEICPKKGTAITLVRGKAVINTENCIGCKKCIYICSFEAVR